MYVRRFHIQHMKRIADLVLDFEHDSQPRMWTVLIGENGIKILKLTELGDEVTQHLVDHVLQGVTDVEQHMRGGRVRQAADRWQSVLALLEPDRNFTAATWCALTYWMDDAQLTEWKLAPLPRPG